MNVVCLFCDAGYFGENTVAIKAVKLGFVSKFIEVCVRNLTLAFGWITSSY